MVRGRTKLNILLGFCCILLLGMFLGLQAYSAYHKGQVDKLKWCFGTLPEAQIQVTAARHKRYLHTAYVSGVENTPCTNENPVEVSRK
ncbi:hypothetical protein vBValSX1_125 [Vibrio phage vB_ValS_X1]|uniref:Uncharacterized protein n=1 Tax=Vibrio phage vB_ValS_X1 TaxID=2736341 RepID=A0A6M9Z6T8_9CAUD|nr:hypothetical protein vBValSX1_125 [Vibrio phage vB_ValS_X1]